MSELRCVSEGRLQGEMTRSRARFLDPRSIHPMSQRHTGRLLPCYRWALLASLAAAAFCPLLTIPPAVAHMKGMFKTKQEAEKRAAELKCKGAFAMGSLWMPCANEQMLHKALQNE
jgi:hypothetical protein